MPNGTLFDHLHGEQRRKNGLRWDARLKIALETASALAYLHFDSYPPIFHRDVKSTNILLDENMGVKVADFGLSRLVPIEASHVSTSPQGTPGYVDPDYNQFYQLTDKSDVYSFGVVLIEIIFGKKAVDELRDGREISLAHMASTKIQMGTLQELVDSDLEFESDPVVNEMITSVAELAFQCLSAEKDDRPCMMEGIILMSLERILGVLLLKLLIKVLLKLLMGMLLELLLEITLVRLVLMGLLVVLLLLLLVKLLLEMILEIIM